MTAIQKALVALLLFFLVGSAGALFFIQRYKNGQMGDLGFFSSASEPAVQQIKNCLAADDSLDTYEQKECERLAQQIRTFEECADLGFILLETHPQQCKTPDGRTFIQTVPPEPDPNDPFVQTSVSQPIKTTGNISCMPFKDKSGAQPAICIFGIKTDDQLYYALDTTLLQPEALAQYPNVEGVEVEGTMVPLEAMSANHWHKYDIQGVIRVEKMVVIGTNLPD